jgi:hypothetical protein
VGLPYLAFEACFQEESPQREEPDGLRYHRYLNSPLTGSSIPCLLRSSILLALLLLLLPSAARARTEQTAASSAALPAIPTLLHEVEARQQELDRARENYTFRESQFLTLVDKHGKVHKTEDKVSHVFFVNGHPIHTLVEKDGKPLNADDLHKEQERASKEAVKYSKPGAESPARDDVSVSRLLAITRFSHPRRVNEDGRSEIAIDFVGDPHAKTHGRDEEALKRVYGTVWIDESAREVAHMTATFDENLHLGFVGMATLEKGSTVSFYQGLIHNEAWLPTSVDGHFDGKALLFVGFHANLKVRYDEYRKFGATATETQSDLKR